MRFMWVLISVIIILVTYALLYYRFDEKVIRKIRENASILARDDKLAALVNGSGINNIRGLNIVSSDQVVERAIDCAKGPIRIGDRGTVQDCVGTCAESDTKLFQVGKNENYYHDSAKLNSGVYCTLGERPECNTKTTMVMMTINSIVCRSRVPRIFGGKTGNSVIACNNVQIQDPLNVLWDYKHDRRVTPFNIDDLTDIDERMDDGAFRFACKFGGRDDSYNNYVEHPFERLHPFKNYCASLVYGAHPSVRIRYNEEYKSFDCDCGDYKTTRLKHLIEARDDTPCSDKSYESRQIDRFSQRLQIPYRCFTVNSPISDVGRYFPCPVEQFTRNSSQMSKVSVLLSNNEYYPIEYPNFNKLPENENANIIKVYENINLF